MRTLRRVPPAPTVSIPQRRIDWALCPVGFLQSTALAQQRPSALHSAVMRLLTSPLIKAVALSRNCPDDVRGRISGQVGAGTLGFLNAQISRLGLGEHAMTESDKIRGIIENAIESTFVKFPDAGDGTTWPQLDKDRAECVTLTTAALHALEKSEVGL